ncbi:MAG: Ig-like domain-containing protein [Paludibacteraceae bacterium]|nr:Ig-like domain-containing protein [Paludibacteraceae bacterium]
MKHLKLFFALFAMLALGVSNAWAETASFSYTHLKGQGASGSGADFTGATIDNIFMSGKGNGNNSYTQIYANGYLTFTPTNATITKIVLTASTASYAKTWSASSGSVSVSDKVITWSGTSDTEVKLTNTATAQARIVSMEVTYTPSAGGDEPPTPTTQYTVKWYTAIGTSTDVTLDEGAAITKPTTDPTMSGYEFMGWTDQCSVAADGTGFTALTDFGTADADKEFYAVFAVATTSGGGAATDVTIDLSTKNQITTNTTSSLVFTEGDVTFTNTKLSGSTAANNYCPGTSGKTYTSTRTYNGHQVTIAAANTISKIVITAGTTGYATAIGNATWTNATASVNNTTITVTPDANAISVSFKPSATAGMTKVVVTTGGGSIFYNNYITTCSGATVVETLTDAQFAWSAATAEATMGASNTFPTLTNTLPVSVTYESVTPATATIDATSGAITLVAPGTTTISAKFAGGEVSGTTYAAKTVTYALTVLKAPATPTSTVYVKVTSTAGITDGEYLIVYEDETAPVAFDGSLAPVKLDVASNNIEVSIASNTIAGNTDIDAATFTINTTAGTIQTKDGYYIGQTSNANGLATSTTTEYTNTISIENDGSATIISSGGAYLRYNSANDNLRFRYYKSSSYASQKAITLYKKTNGQQLAGLAYATTKYLTKLGDAFTTPTLTNPNSLTVTYSSSDNNVATVAADGAVTIKAAGVVKITASFAGNASYLEGSATYTIGVTEHAGTQADPYSVADARRVIDVMETATDVYATGVVSEIVTAYNASYGNITYNISVDGTTTADQLQAYNGKSYNGANFTSADDIKVGDEVVVKGNLKKYNTTYEFDKENQLVSLVRNKAQADLAYAETELTANVGEDFAEPTLSNPYSLSITYSSSNITLATVNATTGEVTILAAGKVTITASTAGDATYAAGSASYNITITNPGLAVATLPFYFDGKRADIENTAGMTHNGIDSDYSAKPHLKFNTAGDWAIVQFDSEPGEFSFLLKQNGSNAGTFTVYESANGEDYTSVWSGGDLGGNGQSATIEPTLSATARYVKFEYTTKGASTNYGLGEISIKKADHRQEAGLAWSPATVSLTVGDAFTAPTFSNPNSLTVNFESSNTELATVNNAGAITLVSGKTGTATITATFADGHADYKPAEATCVITVSPKSEKVVILAQYGDQWYALKAAYLSGKTDRLDAIPVNYVGGKLYNVAEADKASIEWSSVVEGDKVSFLNDGKYLKGKTSTTLLFEEDADGLYQWDNTTYTMTIGTTVRSFLYNGEAFRNFAVSNAGKVVNDVLYSSLPVVTAPVYATGDAYSRSTTAGKFGTICLPFGSTNYTGATFYEFVGSETGKVYLGSVTTLEAGVPYIFEASAAEVAVYGDGTTAATPGNSKGLHGTFTDDTEVAANDDNHILLNNELRKVAETCWVNANRAYIVMSEVPTGVPTQMPGRRYIGMSVQGENAETGFENITAPEGQAIKVISNGQLIIIRDGEMYNAQGQRL